MSTLTKLALGVMGQLRPRPTKGDATRSSSCQHPTDAAACRSCRHSRSAVPPGVGTQAAALPVLSSLLWAAFGVNRRDGGRTAPSAINAQEIDVYVALPDGAYLYESGKHSLRLVAGSDLRRVTGYQDFVDDAPLDLVYVVDHSRMRMIPVASRESYASAAAGAIAQNDYLYAASSGLGTVIRAWIDRSAIADVGLTHDQHAAVANHRLPEGLTPPHRLGGVAPRSKWNLSSCNSIGASISSRHCCTSRAPRPTATPTPGPAAPCSRDRRTRSRSPPAPGARTGSRSPWRVTAPRCEVPPDQPAPSSKPGRRPLRPRPRTRRRHAGLRRFRAQHDRPCPGPDAAAARARGCTR